MSVESQINNLLQNLPRRLQVEFAVFCANDVKHLMNQESITVLELTEKWLKDDQSVTRDEFIAALHAATSSVTSAACAATSYVTSAADAAAASADARAAAAAAAHAAAADAAAHAAAAHAAYFASSAYHYDSYSAYYYASYSAAGLQNKDYKLKFYHSHLISMIKNLTEVERIMWGIE
jgi:hypothetical protein